MKPTALISLLAVLALSAMAKASPNFLIILADDCTYNDLPLYGGQNAKTPHIDRLASEGLTFNRAYLGSSMCQPCRAELYSGLYPMSNGCSWNHSGCRPEITGMPQALGKVGYRVGLAGKSHVRPEKVFPFLKIEGFDPNCVRTPTLAHHLGPIREFMKGKGDDQPFCLVVALTEPHVPWVMGDASKYPPKKLKLPPNVADTPRTREDFSKYLAEITYMDGQVGDILKTLDQTGKANDTLVLFSSEQGSQFPGCKWTTWDTGLHTALVARWPGKVAKGKRTDAMVQYADVLPTLLSLAGGEGKDLDGTSFEAVLTGQKTKHRKFTYGMHNNVPEGPPYPTRTVFDGQYRYTLNLTPDELFIEKHLMGLKGKAVLNNPYWSTWVRDSWNKPEIYALVKRYQLRPPEVLYHTASDPYEMNNLAEDPDQQTRKKALGKELLRWMKEEGDPGIKLDTMKAHSAAREGKHLF
jgi:N-sulfoglucosamine sulfohydrolase